MRDKYQNQGFSKEMNRVRAEKIMKYAPSYKGVCVELGCGEGQITKELVKHFDNVFAFDINKNCMKYLDANVKFYVSDLEKDEIKNLVRVPVDYVVCSNVIEHLSNPKDTLKKISELGDDNTVFFFSVPNGASINRMVGYDCGMLHRPESLGKHDIEAGHKKMYDAISFLKLIKKSFKVDKGRTFYYKPFPNNMMEKLPKEILKQCENMKVTYSGAEIFMVATKKKRWFS